MKQEIFMSRLINYKKHESTTHGIVHAGFIGFRRFVARKKSQCTLIGNRFVIPHDTIPSAVVCNFAKPNEQIQPLVIFLHLSK